MFGPRVPVNEIASQMSGWIRGLAYPAKSHRIVNLAIEEAIQDRMTAAAEDLRDQGEVAYFTFEIDRIEDMHDEAIMRMGWKL